MQWFTWKAKQRILAVHTDAWLILDFHVVLNAFQTSSDCLKSLHCPEERTVKHALAWILYLLCRYIFNLKLLDVYLH
jgi:hypothetical protein